MIHVAVMGYGTIGSGVVEILEKNRETITKRTGDTVNVKYVLDLREFPGTPVENKIVHDFSVIENDPEVTMVIETMGGLNPAYPFYFNICIFLLGLALLSFSKDLKREKH